MEMKFENITFGYKKDKVIFKDLFFEIKKPTEKGFVICLMGGSGSGKSTILKLILGIEKVRQGKIEILPDNPIISYVPQEPILFEHLTPRENAEYFNRVSNYKTKFNRQLFDQIASTLQIQEVLRNTISVNEISGGQKQRISLLRALSIKPNILLLDEPLTGLDEEVKDQFLQTLASLIQEFNLMVIYVTHHRKEAEFISNEIMYLDKEKNSGVVKKIYKTDTNSFFGQPPTISALNATKEISINTMTFRELGNGNIEPIDLSLFTPGSEYFMMSFAEDTINFSLYKGFEFEIITTTGVFTILKLKDIQATLTICTEKFKKKCNNQNFFISFSGNINLYDSKGQFLKMTQIINNQILKIK